MKGFQEAFGAEGISKIMLKWITHFTQAIESQALKTGFVYKLSCQYYRSVAQKEVALAHITQDDHILCIGGGICPFTAILFHQTTGARVTVIDHDAQCIPKAQEVIDRLGIGEKVRVLHQAGHSADLAFADYTVIHFALQVCPMAQVFAAVARRAVSGTRLLVRRPKKALGPMYCPLADCLLPCCSFAVHKARNIGRTMLYTKPKPASGAA